MPSQVLAVEQILRMRGGAQAHLMRCSDGSRYVVKFVNNPQGAKILANEALCALIAQQLQLPTPPFAIVQVPEDLILRTSALVMQLGRGRVPCRPGPCFGSLFAGDLPATKLPR